MREIKFRAWTYQNPPMPWSQKAVAITGEGEQMLPIGGTYTGVWHAFKNAADGGLIIEQYTGLKDKNGREIYEGDIVKVQYPTLNDYYEMVRYEDAGFEPFITPMSEYGNCLEGDMVEVIGNIHENPELLGEEE